MVLVVGGPLQVKQLQGIGLPEQESPAVLYQIKKTGSIKPSVNKLRIILYLSSAFFSIHQSFNGGDIGQYGHHGNRDGKYRHGFKYMERIPGTDSL